MLTPILREGAQKMLAMAIELEAQAWLEERSSLRDEHGHRLVVRNGHQPTRSIQTGVGDVEIVQAPNPRPADRRRSRSVPFEDPAAVSASREGDRRADPVAVSQRDQHRRLH